MKSDCTESLSTTSLSVLLPSHLSRRRAMLATLLAAPALPAFAQFRVEVSGVGLTQLPIVIAQFRGEAQSPQKISAIVQADL